MNTTIETLEKTLEWINNLEKSGIDILSSLPNNFGGRESIKNAIDFEKVSQIYNDLKNGEYVKYLDVNNNTVSCTLHKNYLHIWSDETGEKLSESFYNDERLWGFANSIKNFLA